LLQEEQEFVVQDQEEKGEGETLEGDCGKKKEKKNRCHNKVETYYRT